MGAWGAGSFENDDALDWLDDLESRGLAAVDEALRAAAEAEGAYLEAPDASTALAAAEVVATLRGRPPLDFPGEVEAWAKLNAREPDRALLELARAAVDRVRADSELKELWEESGADEWRAAVDDLLARLA